MKFSFWFWLVMSAMNLFFLGMAVQSGKDREWLICLLNVIGAALFAVSSYLRVSA